MLLEHVVKVQEKLVDDHPNRLVSQRELAEACQANGQIKEAATLRACSQTTRGADRRPSLTTDIETRPRNGIPSERTA
jgi:hypothetical protein